MTNANDPITMLHNASEKDIVFKGLTKREYFSAMAMQGLLASFTMKASNGMWGTELNETAEAAILAADAIIVELNKEQLPPKP